MIKYDNFLRPLLLGAKYQFHAHPVYHMLDRLAGDGIPPTKHTENVMFRVHEAEETLGLAEKYMGELGRGIDALSRIKLTDKKVHAAARAIL